MNNFEEIRKLIEQERYILICERYIVNKRTIMPRILRLSLRVID